VGQVRREPGDADVDVLGVVEVVEVEVLHGGPDDPVQVLRARGVSPHADRAADRPAAAMTPAL